MPESASLVDQGSGLSHVGAKREETGCVGDGILSRIFPAPVGCFQEQEIHIYTAKTPAQPGVSLYFPKFGSESLR
jgi:hypothetical protein